MSTKKSRKTYVLSWPELRAALKAFSTGVITVKAIAETIRIIHDLFQR